MKRIFSSRFISTVTRTTSISCAKAASLLYDSDKVQPNRDDKRFVYVGVPITGLTVEALGGTAKDKGKNIFVLGLFANIFHLDAEKLKGLIRENFGGQEREYRQHCADGVPGRSMATRSRNVLTTLYEFEPTPRASDRAQVTMDGNQALAYGLIAGGVRYGAGYPITPWSSVMETLRREFPKYGGLFVQAEDELAAVSLALGFLLFGISCRDRQRGPGHFAQGGSDRLGVNGGDPSDHCQCSTGRPEHRVADQRGAKRLYQAIFGGHGDSPRVVLAAATVEDCFYIAIEAARIARKYSTPVFILSDTSLATRIEAFDEPNLAELMQDPKPDLTPRPAGFKPYPLEAITQHAPPGTRMLEGKYPVVTGLEHDEMGHPTGCPSARRNDGETSQQIPATRGRIAAAGIHGDPEGDALLVGWGSTYGPIYEAVERARERGESVSALHLRHLHPLPSGLETIFDRFQGSWWSR